MHVLRCECEPVPTLLFATARKFTPLSFPPFPFAATPLFDHQQGGWKPAAVFTLLKGDWTDQSQRALVVTDTGSSPKKLVLLLYMDSFIIYGLLLGCWLLPRARHYDRFFFHHNFFPPNNTAKCVFNWHVRTQAPLASAYIRFLVVFFFIFPPCRRSRQSSHRKVCVLIFKLSARSPFFYK
jgi:hypothetical protein